MTVGELMNNMTSRELVEWRAFFDIMAEEEEARQLAVKAQSGLEARKQRKRRK